MIQVHLHTREANNRSDPSLLVPYGEAQICCLSTLVQALNTRELEVIYCSGELLLTRGGGDLVSLSLLRRSGSLSLSLLHRTAAGFSLNAPAIWLSLSLLTVWFLSHCSGVRWRRSGVEKGGGYLVIDINYFPGYEKLPCYETIMTDFFLNLLKSHTVEKTTVDD
ncbi:hypothetical protein L6452_39147 [Arctium lappa]|uniref:Uncharacterized protein n=1 Tax=Arctium lappa TaxID=4217 RepID=A0ACB8XVL6_ARCLA|nr:hypothetical protein L6452_39147 [Arctium lappa]